MIQLLLFLFISQKTSSVLRVLIANGPMFAALTVPPLFLTFWHGTRRMPWRLYWQCLLCLYVRCQWAWCSWSTEVPRWWRPQEECLPSWLCSVWWEPVWVCFSSWDSLGMWCVISSCRSSPFSKQQPSPLSCPSHCRYNTAPKWQHLETTQAMKTSDLQIHYFQDFTDSAIMFLFKKINCKHLQAAPNI